MSPVEVVMTPFDATPTTVVSGGKRRSLSSDKMVVPLPLSQSLTRQKKSPKLLFAGSGVLTLLCFNAHLAVSPPYLTSF
jgi:hypothetical protein